MEGETDEVISAAGTVALPPVQILIVDDRPENLLAIRGVLSAPDYVLVEARSGEEALRKLLGPNDFALVLLDVRMPGIDGFEVAQLMRRRERTRAVPIVFLTAEAADIESAYQGYEAGGIDYVIKPIDPLVLRAKVAAFAELHQQREQIRRQGELLLAAETRVHTLRMTELQLDAERREKAALAEAVRARDEFLALASHELNTPLTPLLTSIQQLLRSVRSGRAEAPSTVRALEIAQRQIRRLARLVAELLEVTRLESGQLKLAVERVDLVELVRHVIEAHADHDGPEVRFVSEGEIVGQWDRVRIEQIATNLLTNALKFGGQQPVDVTVRCEGDRARLSVRDSGIGIGADQIDRIFERFGRAESVRHYGGLGLGLFIVKKIVEAHGGTVRVESVLGEGSTFTVELPM